MWKVLGGGARFLDIEATVLDFKNPPILIIGDSDLGNSSGPQLH